MTIVKNFAINALVMSALIINSVCKEIYAITKVKSAENSIGVVKIGIHSARLRNKILKKINITLKSHW